MNASSAGLKAVLELDEHNKFFHTHLAEDCAHSLQSLPLPVKPAKEKPEGGQWRIVQALGDRLAHLLEEKVKPSKEGKRRFWLLIETEGEEAATLPATPSPVIEKTLTIETVLGDLAEKHALWSKAENGPSTFELDKKIEEALVKLGLDHRTPMGTRESMRRIILDNVAAVLGSHVGYDLACSLGEDSKTDKCTKPATPAVSSVPKFYSDSRVDPIGLNVGRGLLCLVDAARGSTLLKRVTALRSHLHRELGAPVPGVRFRDNLQLNPQDYSIELRGVEIATGTVYPDKFLAIGPEEKLEQLPGTTVREPAYGMPARWLESSEKTNAERMGCLIMDCNSVIASHLTEVLSRHADQLLTYNDALTIMKDPALAEVIKELIPFRLEKSDVWAVLQGLLREQVPIGDRVLIFQTLLRFSRDCRDINLLTEQVRRVLAPHILRRIHLLVGENPFVYHLSAELEEMLEEEFSDELGARFQSELVRQVRESLPLHQCPIIVTSAEYRAAVRELTRHSFPEAWVLCYEDIPKGSKVRRREDKKTEAPSGSDLTGLRGEVAVAAPSSFFDRFKAFIGMPNSPAEDGAPPEERVA